MRRVTDEKHRRFSDMIHTSGQHLLGLVNTILDVAKIEAGKLVVALHEEELLPIVDESMSLYALDAQTKGLTLERADDGDFQLRVICDRMRLLQVLNNLISNAVKFTASGVIRIGVRREAGGVIIDVTDTGSGIPLDAERHVFERFRQADNLITREFGGSGVGLSLSYDLARLMNGQMGFTSEPGRGSRFWVSLPVAVVNTTQQGGNT